jgi:hypothetical protein
MGGLCAGMAYADSDPTLGSERGRFHLFHLAREPVDVFSEDLDYGCSLVLAAFKLVDANGHFLICRDELAHFDEGPNDGDAHLGCALASQNGGEHSHTVFGECEWRVFRVCSTPFF